MKTEFVFFNRVFRAKMHFERSIFFYFCVFISIPSIIFSQSQQVGTRIDKLINVIPPSPDAASLGKYGNIPVGLFTGVPNITIPLYTLKEGDIELPISLNYHSRGLKVSEIASSTGLGWTLFAGGVITRMVRGMPDESGSGYLLGNSRISPLTIPLPSTLSDEQYIALENLAYNFTDSDPDLFNFNFLGRSGKFFFDSNKNIHLATTQDLKINVNPDFSSWTITDESGAQFVFSAKEQTISSTNQDTPIEEFTSSWYLTSIVSRQGYEIKLYYTSEGGIFQDDLLVETDTYRKIPQLVDNDCYQCPYYNGQIRKFISKQIITTQKLLRIESSQAVVYFDKDTQVREDLTSDYALSGIRVLVKDKNIILKSFKLNYSYFFGGVSNGNYGGDKGKRLKLLGVEDRSEITDIRKHSFFYDETVLPPRDSYAQDYWGYYNGAETNTTLLPKTYDLPYGLPFANRLSNPNYCSAGLLNKIVYPTGGYTAFEFEPNQSIVQEFMQHVYSAEVSSVNQPVGTEVSTSFVIQEGQYVDIEYQVTLGNYPEESATAQLIITNQTGQEVVHYYGTGNAVYPVYFEPGHYNMKLISPDNPESNLQSQLHYFVTTNETINKVVGGARLKKTIDYDPVTTKSVIKSLEYPAVAVLTGARNDNDFLGDHTEKAPRHCEISNTTPMPYIYKCQYRTRSSAIRYSYGDIVGGHIAYPTVKEKFGLNGELGFIVNDFNFEGAHGGGGFPYAPALVYESRNGLLLSRKIFNSDGALTSEIINTYNFTEKFRETLVKVGFLFDDPETYSYRGANPDVITHDYYFMISERVDLTSTTSKEYDNLGHCLINKKEYFYENLSHHQFTRERSENSKSELLVTKIKFPHDYGEIEPYAEMVKRNLIVPIEEKLIDVNKNKLLVTKKTNFQLWNNNKFILPVSITSSRGEYLPENDLVILSYDSKGNIQEYIGRDKVINCLIWGYNKQHVVARIKGKTLNDIIEQSGIDLSVFENAVGSLGYSAELNKLSILPGFFVETFTHSPLIGLTSKTDHNGRKIFYEYDLSGRLKLIKDQDGKILKVMDYKYQQ